MSETIRISEIFGPTIQGEGALIGQPSIFVRTGGCDFRCSWCDTLYAVESKYRHEWKSISAKEIMARVEELSGGAPLMVTLSGGNPAIQDLSEVIRLGKERGYRFNLETQGSVAQDWFKELDVLTLSPKGPSSGMETDWAQVAACIAATGENTKVVLKFVVFDEGDYGFAKEGAKNFKGIPVYLQPGNDMRAKEVLEERMVWLAEKVMQDGWFAAHVLPQLHVMMWGNNRGV